MTSKSFIDVDSRQLEQELKIIRQEKLTETVFNSVVAKAVAKTAGEFAGEVKKEVPQFFKTFSTKKLKSISGHRGKEKKITYHVGAGEGIPGHLNYFAGLYKGEAKSKSGKVFRYKQPRDIIGAAQSGYDVKQKAAVYLDQYIKELME